MRYSKVTLSYLAMIAVWWSTCVGGLAATLKADEARSQKAQTVIQESLQAQVQQMLSSMSSDAREGYRHLTESVYLPADFDEEVFAEIELVKFPLPFKDFVTPADSHAATWARFGLSARPDDPSRPLQYVVTESGKYVMNCFACHGGNLFGTSYPGAPNTLYALETLTEQVRRAKLRLQKPMTHMDIGSILMPLGTSVGTSNSVMFGVSLMNFRDAQLNVHPDRVRVELMNHDMDAPAWWLFRRKQYIYADGFAEKGHRGLMQFMLVKENGPKQFQQWEDDFRKVFAFLNEVKPPKYPLTIDRSLAWEGKKIFNAHCSRCHGTYTDRSASLANASLTKPGANDRDASEAADDTYPEICVPIDDVGTDPVRLAALTPRHRDHYGQSWFGGFGTQATKVKVDGYVAPPLDGIWASAPYFHNGSVPTLWHVLHPAERPQLWRRVQLGLDIDRVGLGIEVVDEVPNGLSAAERRWFFDTRNPGKSASGHDYPDELSETEKHAVLEYLKTL